MKPESAKQTRDMNSSQGMSHAGRTLPRPAELLFRPAEGSVALQLGTYSRVNVMSIPNQALQKVSYFSNLSQNCQSSSLISPPRSACPRNRNTSSHSPTRDQYCQDRCGGKTAGYSNARTYVFRGQRVG